MQIQSELTTTHIDKQDSRDITQTTASPSTTNKTESTVCSWVRSAV